MRTRIHPHLGAILLGLLLLLAAMVLLTRTSDGRPTIRSSFFAQYPTAVGSRIDDLPSKADHCGMCHYDFNGAGPKNPYGNRLAAVLGNFGNNDAGRRQAMVSIENEDSDGDGVSNKGEITDVVTWSNTPTFPGLTPGNVGSVVNVPVPAELTGYLVPTTGVDGTPPAVVVLSPDGGQIWTSGLPQVITWSATDASGISAVSVYFRDGASAPWRPIALAVPNSGAQSWFVPSLPTTGARVRVVATDNAGNIGADESNADFTVVRAPGGIVATTLRDFELPGTQPLGAGSFSASAECISCHGGYDSAIEPGANFKGSMMAQAARDPLFEACLAIVEQDAPAAGDLCIRCHTPPGWLAGRSQPTTGTALVASDRDGVNCDFCHRLVDPIDAAGVSPVEDDAVLAAMLPAHRPDQYGSGMAVVDPNPRRRGPFADAAAPHPFLASAFHRSSDLCATCHDVSNPAFDRTGPADYAPGPLDALPAHMGPEHLMPLERTYSEWKASAFPAGVYAPDFAGSKPDGIVSTCQDCHIRDVTGRGCNDPGAPDRTNLPLHDMTGGNAWMPGVIAARYPGETDAAALAAGADRARAMLTKAATVAVVVVPEADSFRAEVTITNRTGHKLPTGYPEGRRAWLHVEGFDGLGVQVFESGAYDGATGTLYHDAQVTVYETHLGISPPLAAALGLSAGPSFHFALNDTVYKDNRIPPAGFTNTGFAAFGGAPVDPERSGVTPRYADGQHWDVALYRLPPTARSVRARLYYQTTSKEYVEFLRDENTTNTAGQTMYDLWVAHGRSAPVWMAADSATFAPLAVDPARPVAARLTPLGHPFRGAVALRLDLERPARVRVVVTDLLGRRESDRDYGMLAAGPHRLAWSPTELGLGLHFVRVTAGDQVLTRQVARLR